MLAFANCVSTGVKFDPNYHVGDSANGQIVPREPFPIISCYDERFDEYACMHKDKVKELKELLAKAKLPRRDRD
jgi:hypothetical protein